MKKIVLFCLLILTLVFAFAACGGKETPPNNESENGGNTVHTHSFGEWDLTVKPTCEENGEKVRYCSCGEKHTETVLPLGHTPDEAVEEDHVPATCYNKGSYEIVIYCSNCGVELERTKHTISIIDHTPASLVEENINDSTCYQVGSKDLVFYCAVEECHAELARNTVTIDKKNHTPSEVVIENEIAATCTTDGSYDEVVYCIDENCKQEIIRTTKVILSEGHNYVDEFCSKCGKEYFSEGLNFISNGDGTCYVSGIGSCKDTTVKIPSVSPEGDSVTSIGGGAFSYSSNLISVIVPEGVTKIGESAFLYCKNLESVNIPKSVTQIAVAAGESPFYGCNYDKLFELENGIYYLDNWAIDKQYHFSPQIVIREGTIGLRDGLFMLTLDYYTSITIPNSVNIIGRSTFDNCTGLTSIIIPDSVTSIGGGAFYYCSSLTSITIPDSVTSIGGSAFSYCTSLTSITIPDSVTSIGSSAFAYCSSLESITIPKSVTSIGSYAFRGCSSLTSITVDENNANYKSIDGNLYTKDGKTLIQYAIGKTNSSFTIPNSVTSIGSSAFGGCSSLTSVTIPDSVTSIGSSAFGGCSSLTSVTIGNGVTSIGSYAFSDCSSLKFIVIPTDIASIGNYAFYKYTKVCYTGSEDDWSKVNIGTNEKIFNHYLYYYSEITPATAGHFWHYENSSPVVWPSSSVDFIYTSNGDGTCYISGIGTYTDTDVIIPAISPDGLKVIGIGDHVFTCDTMYVSYYIDITSVYIPEGIITISSGAFSFCKSLTNITIPNSVITIEDEAFSNCSSLTSITIPDSVTSIGDGAFQYCDSLVYNEYDNAYYLGNNDNPYLVLVKAKDTSITTCVINKNTKFIYNDAFYNCEGLTSITISDSVTSIGGSAFYNCSNLASIIIPDSVTSIGDLAFYYCSSLTSVVIPDSVTSIGYGAFSRCSRLTSVYYTGSAEEWYKILVDSGNDYLKNATIYYNYTY